jgi:hypothetical protein
MLYGSRAAPAPDRNSSMNSDILPWMAGAIVLIILGIVIRAWIEDDRSTSMRRPRWWRRTR